MQHSLPPCNRRSFEMNARSACRDQLEIWHSPLPRYLYRGAKVGSGGIVFRLFALLQSRQPIGDPSICSRSGSRRHRRGDVRISFDALSAAQRLGLHVEGSGAIAGRLRRPGHRVEGDVDAAATAEAGDGAGGFRHAMRPAVPPA